MFVKDYFVGCSLTRSPSSFQGRVTFIIYYSEIIWPDFVLAVNVSHTLLRNLEIAIRLKVLDEERVVRLLVRHLVVKMSGEQC